MEVFTVKDFRIVTRQDYFQNLINLKLYKKNYIENCYTSHLDSNFLFFIKIWDNYQ